MTTNDHLHVFCIDPIVLHCERCGLVDLVVNLPCSIEAFCTIAGAFITAHQSCQLKERSA